MSKEAEKTKTGRINRKAPNNINTKTIDVAQSVRLADSAAKIIKINTISQSSLFALILRDIIFNKDAISIIQYGSLKVMKLPLKNLLATNTRAPIKAIFRKIKNARIAPISILTLTRSNIKANEPIISIVSLKPTKNLS